MIKRIKEPGPESLIITEPKFKEFIEKWESEINRGLSTLCTLSIIKNSGKGGIHGYRIVKELEEKTNDILIIEEGTLYPLLRKIEGEGLIGSKKTEVDGRLRKNYYITEYGIKVFTRMEGFYSKLTEAISPLFDVKVKLELRYLYCPDCANKIDLSNEYSNFCEICGRDIKEIKEKRLKK